jgi:hypothetical protein
MVKRYNRLLAAIHIASDSVLAALAFILAYVLRFQTGLVPVTKGYPPFTQYLALVPVIASIVPFAFYLQDAEAPFRFQDQEYRIQTKAPSRSEMILDLPFCKSGI